jgi:hypothetical protein
MLMVDMTLDTHAFVKTLTAAGMPEPQAEAVTSLVTAARDADATRFISKSDLANLAAKADLALLSTKADLAGLTTKLELADTKSDILKWMFGMVGGAVVLNVVTVVGGMLALLRMSSH